MSGLLVINRERMERLKPQPFTTIPFNMNTLSVIVLLICMIVLYRRYVKVKKSREQRHI